MSTSLLRESDQRVRIGRAATLTYTHVDSDGVEATPTTCTIGIVRADGTELVAAGTATTGTGATRTYSLAAQTTLDQLTVTWTVDSVAHVEYVDVVGGVIWATNDARTVQKALVNYTDTQMVRGRDLAEREFVDITGRALVPTYERIRIRGSCSSLLILPHWDLRAVREVVELDEYGATSYTWTATDRSRISCLDAGYLELRSGWWPDRELIVGYEHGMDRAPIPVVEATIRRATYWLSRTTSTLLDRATTYTPDGAGGTYRIIQPGANQTGDPEVDAVYGRYRRMSVGIA